MIRVRKMRLHLPGHMRHQSEAVARLAAERLARQTAPNANGSIDRLQVGPVTAAKGASRHQVAGDVAQAIGCELSAKRGQGREG
ncbi:MAG: hypothetical protein AAFX92_15230 [Pseudomonadota bacterium]